MHTPAPTAAGHAVARPTPRTLDRRRLLDAIATRRSRLAALEDSLVADCEATALRAAASAAHHADRGTWDRFIWDRYLARAAALESAFGPAMRRLHDEIERLERLTDMPIAA